MRYMDGMKMEQPHHPGSACLKIFQEERSDIIPLTKFKEQLESRGAAHSIQFLKKIATQEWYEKFGFKITPHPEKANKLKLIRNRTIKES